MAKSDHWLLAAVLCAAVLGVVAAAGSGNNIVNVSNDEQFFSALANPGVHTIALLDHITLDESSGNWTPFQPLLRTSNVTVQSACGAQCTSDDFMTLDFAFVSGIVMLDTNVVLTFRQVVLTKYRKPARLGMDFVTGRPGSGIVFIDLIAYRLVCPPNHVQTQTLQNNALLPSAPHQRAVTFLDGFCWRGTCFNDTMHYVDYAAQVAATNYDNSLSVYGADSGYFFWFVNCTRLCAFHWPMDCLMTMTADECTTMYVDLALQQAAAGGARPALLIAVPVVAAASILMLGVLVLFVVRRRRRSQYQKDASAPGGADIEHGVMDPRHGGPMHVVNFASGPPLLTHNSAGWQLLAWQTNPLLDSHVEPADDVIQLGALLGGGSAGRVYRAKWRNRDVAVKVLQHDAGRAGAVGTEADLMMKFAHPNIVTALHVVTWCQNDQPATAKHHQPAQGKGERGAAASCADLAHSDSADAIASRDQRGVRKSSPEPTASTLTPSGALYISGLHVSYSLPGHLSSWPHAVDAMASGGAGGGGFERAGASGAGISSVARSSEGLHTDGTVGNSLPRPAQTWLIVEFCNGNTLMAAVRAGRYHTADGKPNMAKVLTTLHDVACGMRYLHARNVLHRDLKAPNVLLKLDSGAPYGAVAKVADFGLSYTMRPGTTHHSSRTLGTVSHMAPELLRAGRHSPAADVYAFGVLMWEVVSGRAPFSDACYGEVFERVALGGERPALEPALQEALGSEVVLLMESCWAASPALRPTFEQVCDALVLLLQCRGAQPRAPGTPVVGDAMSALTTGLTRHWNVIKGDDTEQVEQEPLHGYF